MSDVLSIGSLVPLPNVWLILYLLAISAHPNPTNASIVKEQYLRTIDLRLFIALWLTIYLYMGCIVTMFCYVREGFPWCSYRYIDYIALLGNQTGS